MTTLAAIQNQEEIELLPWQLQMIVEGKLKIPRKNGKTALVGDLMDAMFADNAIGLHVDSDLKESKE